MPRRKSQDRSEPADRADGVSPDCPSGRDAATPHRDSAPDPSLWPGGRSLFSVVTLPGDVGPRLLVDDREAHRPISLSRNPPLDDPRWLRRIAGGRSLSVDGLHAAVVETVQRPNLTADGAAIVTFFAAGAAFRLIVERATGDRAVSMNDQRAGTRRHDLKRYRRSAPVLLRVRGSAEPPTRYVDRHREWSVLDVARYFEREVDVAAEL